MDKKYQYLKDSSVKYSYQLIDEGALERRVSQLDGYFNGEKGKDSFDWLIPLSGLCSIHSCYTTALLLESSSVEKLNCFYSHLRCYICSNLKVPLFFSAAHKEYSYFEGRVNNDLCLCVVLALIFDDKSMLMESVRLLDGLKQAEFSERFVADMPYVDFVSNLARLDLSQELVDVNFETSFNEVFRNWEDVSELKKAIEGILDYHLFVGQPGKNYRSEEYEKYYPEVGYTSPFDTYDLSVMPYEVIAIYKVRQRQGLPFPEIDHPLLSNELLGLFKENLASDYSDELLEKIYDFINSKK
ncbi:MAG: hypothetical protein ACRBBR_05130 [Cellvibrionaceae bacterium]